MNDVDTILNKIRDNSMILSNYHRKRYLFLKGRLKYYRIPIIVISAINSVGAVSLQNFFPQKYISLLNMFLSLSVGIIGSIEMFFNITKQMESELSESKNFYVLGCDIFKYLSLGKVKRMDDETTFLNEIYARYIKLVESSMILKKKVADKLVSIININIEEEPQIPDSPINSESDSDFSKDIENRGENHDENNENTKKHWFNM